MRRWLGAASALVAAAVTIAIVQIAWPRPDFPPFVMTIEEWSSQRIGFTDGRRLAGTYVYRLEYHRRDHWTLALVFDEIPGHSRNDDPHDVKACRHGAYGYVDRVGTFHSGRFDPAMCNGLGRWIHYGVAWRYPWKKEVGDGRITYTDPGERVVFDAKTGLPLLYEAGRVGGSVGYRTTFRIEHWIRP